LRLILTVINGQTNVFSSRGLRTWIFHFNYRNNVDGPCSNFNSLLF